MSAETGIEWCDSTLNFWAGCTKVSPACDFCYAERQAGRFGIANWGAGQPRKQMVEATRAQSEKWNKLPFYECVDCGWRGAKLKPTGSVVDGVPAACCAKCDSVNVVAARRRVFVNSWSDWLDNEVPAEWLADLLDRIRRCPNIDFLLLTKRIGNWRGRIEAARNSGLANVALMNWLHDWQSGDPPANVWIGATVINQAEADRDVPKLLKVAARIRFLSIEPMLGPISLGYYDMTGVPKGRYLDWIIAGGESGPHARPSHPEWYRRLRDQCAAAGVPFMFKQHGEWLPTDFCDDDAVELPSKRTVYVNFDGSYVDGSDGFDFFGGFAETAWVGKKAAGRVLDGVKHSGFPAMSP
ncbi:phage Gp37/Gp68 family protein [Nevskia ramosa]|uniref:phage Gp37/Gp68 family protein n=1 Tax=Nevskia ramosa TaxID=64002 RepID=UPI003D0ED701